MIRMRWFVVLLTRLYTPALASAQATKCARSVCKDTKAYAIGVRYG